MPGVAILYDGWPTSSLPSKRIEPRDARGGGMPMIALQSVVLPMPLRPTIATDSLPIANVTSCRTARGP